jgi:5'-3' exonuclease
MGVFQFYSWFRRTFPENIYKVQRSINSELSLEIDNLLIDMNGLFHTSAQKVFKYGSFKPPYEIIIKENNKTHQLVFQDICETLENILFTVNPKRKVILCVDGPAPVAKQCQQRKRRYKSALERGDDDKSFDSNQLTPGTKFMDHLSKYIDWFIRKRLSENPLWQNIEIIYSPSSVPSEGEQKLLAYVRKFGDKNESYVIHGLDADLIMLSLLTHYPKFYVLRDDTFDHKNNFLLIDIGDVREKLVSLMFWDKSEDSLFDFKFNREWAINDFVFVVFLTGNDFLPHIPSIEIIEGGIEVIIEISKNVGRTHGHITRNKTGNIVFCKSSLKRFLEIVSESEKELLEQKFKHRSRYFEDPILQKAASYNITDQKYEIDIDVFREHYNDVIFDCNEKEIENASFEYLAGLQWILRYYTKEVPSWRWHFPYHYAPTASTLVKHIDSFEFPRSYKGKPLTPLQQLLCVLPPKSSKLLPVPLDSLISTKLKKFNPDDVEIDLSGKKHEYMGIVKLPFIDLSVIKKVHDENIDKVDERDRKRNNFGKNLYYKHDPTNTKEFKSYYGNIKECMVSVKVIEF